MGNLKFTTIKEKASAIMFFVVFDKCLVCMVLKTSASASVSDSCFACWKEKNQEVVASVNCNSFPYN